MIIPKGYRGCKICGELKPFKEMVKCKPCRHGRAQLCNKCNNERARKYIKDRKDTRKETKEIRAERHLRYKYNMSIDTYNEMLENQNYCCLICNVEFDSYEQSKKPFVDHCHTTGKIRGLLCTHCNSGIGFLKESPEIMKQAIIYLENSRAI